MLDQSRIHLTPLALQVQAKANELPSLGVGTAFDDRRMRTSVSNQTHLTQQQYACLGVEGVRDSNFKSKLTLSLI